ncbi:MAG: 50S ribosomal protein L18 [Candidatus Sericytochromatia bacterium]|nr:50S ribosomal protein L18 [Candidatus Sericytochromatia bacterium]
MINKNDRREVRLKRRTRIRGKVSGTAERPRLAVFRSSKHIYAQLIDDVAGITLASAGSTDPDLRGQLQSGATVAAATIVGASVAEKAKAKGIEAVVYDRGGNLYHGRVKALADAARGAGLLF